MKRASRRNSVSCQLSADVVRSFMQAMSEDHQKAWHAELTSDAPYWVHLLALHLRLVEIDHLEEAVGDLL